MKAVVMAGGEGSRLRPLTSGRPKPLVPVVGKPVMEHILTLLRKHGITEEVVTLQYLGSAIRDYFGDGSDFGMEITYVVEDSPLGTAGSVKNAQEYLDEPFLVISGDALTDIDLGAAIRFHEEKSAMATIVLYSVPNPLEFGVATSSRGCCATPCRSTATWLPAIGVTSATSRPTTRLTGMRCPGRWTSRSRANAARATCGWERTWSLVTTSGSSARPTWDRNPRSRRGPSSTAPSAWASIRWSTTAPRSATRLSGTTPTLARIPACARPSSAVTPRSRTIACSRRAP